MESFNALISARRIFAERTSPRPTWRERASAAPTWSGRTSARPTWRERPSAGPTWSGRTSARPTWSERTSARPTSRERTSSGLTSRGQTSAGPTWRERTSAGPTWRERTSAAPTWRERLVLPRQDPPRKSPQVAASSDLRMKSQTRSPWLLAGGTWPPISPGTFSPNIWRPLLGWAPLRYRKPHTHEAYSHMPADSGGGATSTQPAVDEGTNNERDQRSRSRKDSTRLLPAGVKLLR